ncbi:hypothetical protein VNI00_017847 [Paramarasmius palmivorus]|uniref:Uncharacterized protein n=1 Tax=Paramarasmius palmivorus TaxID=297713 RepID=A0AAW0B2B4_9AGAR
MTQFDLDKLMERTLSMSDCQCHTHADEAAVTFIKSLSLKENFKMNSCIRQENSERKRKMFEHARDPSKPAGSPVASYVDITSEDWGQIMELKSLFERLKPYMPDRVLAKVESWMAMRDKGKGAASTNSDDSIYVPHITEQPYEIQHIASIMIPKELKHLHLTDKLPLALLTDANLGTFLERESQIPIIKKPVLDGSKASVLSLD